MEIYKSTTERKSYGAKCGHVKRRVLNGDPLTGKVLEFALGLVEPSSNDKSEHGKFLKGISEKFKTGELLSEYEAHIVVDVILCHAKF